MPAQPPGSRSGTATILFTDLVDSTAVNARLGEERAEVARQAHQRLLTEVVATHHGTLHKDLGDGIMASFAGAADAVAAAVAIQQAIASAAQRDDDAPVAIRVGISAGDVAWERGHPNGMPLVEASRLCGVAEGGQILVADIVRVLARGRGGHAFTPVGQIALKGIAEPVAACAVAWERLLPTAGIPLPARLGTRAAFAMFGRSGEEEILARAWEKARDGERQLVLIAGEPGIGKTRLAVEAARMAHAEGATVLFGGCDEDVGLPYRPFVEALRHYVAHASSNVLAAHVQVHRGELTRLVPELTRRVANVPSPQVAEAETERFLLFEAVTGLLAAASQASPVVLVLDDLQWAATPEVLLLKHLVRSAEPMRLLVIATYRDSDLSATHPLTTVLADLRRETGIERVALDGLDETAVEALVTAVARHELDPALTALARAIQRETEGNPFFIGEVIRHLSESGALVQEDGQWTYRGKITDLGIPEGVRDVVGRRLGRLSATTRRVLGLAAVIGRHFDLALLLEIAEASEEAVLDALDEASAAALVTEVRGSPGHFAFRHALIQSTLYDEQSATRRARLHRRVGEALEALVAATSDTRVEELAYHWLAASRSDDIGKAISYARQAGERALASLAFEEAAAHFERALAVFTPRGPEAERLGCDLLLALGDAQRRAGIASYAETAMEAVAVARRLGDAQRFAKAALLQGRAGGLLSNTSTINETAIALYEEANAALGDDDSIVRARILARLAAELANTSQRERRYALAHEAVDMARRLGDRAGLAQVLGAAIFAIIDPFTVQERLALGAELETLSNELDSLELRFDAAYLRANAFLESGDASQTKELVARMEQLARELRQPVYAWLAALARAMLAVLAGIPDAEALALAAFQIAMDAGQPDAASLLSVQIGAIRRNQGRYSREMADALRSTVVATPHVAWRAGFALMCCESDHLTDASELFQTFTARGFDVSVNYSWALTMHMVAEVCHYLRDADSAALLYPRLEPVADQVTVTGCTSSNGAIGYPAGLLAACLGRWADAERHFVHALAMNARIGARPYYVRTERGYADMLLDRGGPGDATHAIELIASGLAEAETLGLAREIVRFERLSERLKPAAIDRAVQAFEDSTSSELRRCEILLVLAGRLGASGNRDAAWATFDRAADIARRLAEPVLLARAALGVARVAEAGVSKPGVAQLLEEALTSLGDRNDRLRARLLAALTEALQSSTDQSRSVALSDEALALARGVCEPRTLVRALMSRYVALSDPAHAATRVDLAREVVSVAETFGETESAKRGQERLHQASADLDAARAIEAESVATTPPVHEPPSAPEPRPTEALPVPPRPGAFRREGGIWMIGLDAASCHLKDLIGLRYLEQLLRSPGQEFHVLDLVTTVSGSDAGLPRSSDVGPMLDAGAKTAYRRRLADLREEADEAEHFADVGRRERAQAEIDALTAELTSAVGLGGRDRVTGATTERARSTVTHAIRSAIRRLHKDVPTLAEELDLRVRTGIYCLYVPDSTRPIAWTF